MNRAQRFKVNEDQLDRMLPMVDESLKFYVERCQVWVQIEMAIQKLKIALNVKIEACDVSYQMVMDSCNEIVSNEDVDEIDVEEFMMIFQSIELKIMKNAEIKKVMLELPEKVKQIPCEDSSSLQGDNVKKNANLKTEGRSHSNYFLILCLKNVKTEITEQMENLKMRENVHTFWSLLSQKGKMTSLT